MWVVLCGGEQQCQWPKREELKVGVQWKTLRRRGGRRKLCRCLYSGLLCAMSLLNIQSWYKKVDHFV